MFTWRSDGKRARSDAASSPRRASADGRWLAKKTSASREQRLQSRDARRAISDRGARRATPRCSSSYHGLHRLCERIAPRRLDLDRAGAFGDQPRDRDRPRHVLRHANDPHGPSTSPQRSIGEIRGHVRRDQAAVAVAFEDAHRRRRRQLAHQARLFDRRHERVAIGGEIEHRRGDRRQLVADVVVAQDAQARQIAFARRRRASDRESAGSRRARSAANASAARSAGGRCASCPTAWRAAGDSRATAAPAIRSARTNSGSPAARRARDAPARS